MPTLLWLPLVMVMTPMTDLLQLPQNERLALAIALWDSLDCPLRRARPALGEPSRLPRSGYVLG